MSSSLDANGGSKRNVDKASELHDSTRIFGKKKADTKRNRSVTSATKKEEKKQKRKKKQKEKEAADSKQLEIRHVHPFVCSFSLC